MRIALWVFPSKWGELREGNSENLKHGNRNHVNSDTRGVERKIGALFLQRNYRFYHETVILTRFSLVLLSLKRTYHLQIYRPFFFAYETSSNFIPKTASLRHTTCLKCVNWVNACPTHIHLWSHTTVYSLGERYFGTFWKHIIITISSVSFRSFNDVH